MEVLPPELHGPMRECSSDSILYTLAFPIRITMIELLKSSHMYSIEEMCREVIQSICTSKVAKEYLDSFDKSYEDIRTVQRKAE